MQYYTRDVDGKLYARVPGGLQPQSWFILENTTDNSYMYVSAIRLEEAKPTAHSLPTGLSSLMITLIGSFPTLPLERRYE